MNIVDLLVAAEYNDYVYPNGSQRRRKRGFLTMKYNMSKRLFHKTITILLALIVLTLTACSSGNEISIEIPSLLTYEMSENQIKNEAKELGCKSYNINADGSVTYIFSESGHEKAIESQTERLKRADSTRTEIYGDSADFTCNGDRTKYTLYVEKWGDGFYSVDRLEALSYLYEGAYYQLICGTPIDDVEVTATVIDNSSQKILETGYFSSWYTWYKANSDGDIFSDAAVTAAFSKPDSTPSGTQSEASTPIENSPSLSMNDNIELNETFMVGEVMEISLNSYEWNDRVVPSDTSGGYLYIDGEEGETYFIVHGTLKSFAGSSFDIDYCSEATITINDKYDFSARIKLEDNDHTGFNGSVKPLQTLNLVIYGAISDEVKNIAETVQVNFSVVSDEEALKYFYDDRYPHENYTITFFPGQESSAVGTVVNEGVSPVCEVGTEYQEDNGLFVTLNSFSITEQEGYNIVRISYTVRNNTPDTKVMPGSFKLFFTDGTGEPQYGGFDYLFYGESDEREYEWKVLKTQEILALEYNANDDDAGLDGAFFRDRPIDGALHWIP